MENERKEAVNKYANLGNSKYPIWIKHINIWGNMSGISF